METTSRPAILVALDGSPPAEQAIAYARGLLRPGGEVILLRVVQSADGEAWWGRPMGEGGLVGAEREGRAYLRSVADRLLPDGPAVRLEVATGDPAEEIIRIAEAEQVEMIVMTTHGRGAAGRVLFGSVADRVARHGTRPTLLLRAGESGGPAPSLPDRLVVPLDGSPLSETALPVATRLAARLGRPIQLLHVVGHDAILAEIGRRRWESTNLSADDTYEMSRAVAIRNAESYLAKHVARLRAAHVDAELAVEMGTAVFVILRFLRPGDLVVMTSQGRGGLRRWLLGSVAEKLVREAPAPVLLVRAGQAAHGAAT